MASKYIDKDSILQVLGGLMKNPSLMVERADKYTFNAEDFGESFHKAIFGAVYNLKLQGSNKIDAIEIDKYLALRPVAHKIFVDNKGLEYIEKCIQISELENFEYYYNRMKKFTLLRMYDNYGINVKWLYNPDNVLDIGLKQKQEDWLNKTDIIQIATAVDNKIEEIKGTYLNITISDSYQAGDDIDALIDKFKESPEVGIPLYGPIINTITRGARLKKFYLRSAPSGVGKSRMSAADIAYFSCKEIYDLKENKWIPNPTGGQPSLYITTELEKEEIQTMWLSFLSGVQEDNILNGEYDFGEEDRVRYAAKILKESPLWLEAIADFSLQDIENLIRKNVRDNGVKYVALM